jgi:glycerol-3-phosphate dehydrogenase
MDVTRHLAFGYGSNFDALIRLMLDDERLREPLVAGLPHVKAEVVYAARHELALSLTDALMRRTRLAMLAGEASLGCARIAAELMAAELGWNKEEMTRQVNLFAGEFEREYQAAKQ